LQTSLRKALILTGLSIAVLVGVLVLFTIWQEAHNQDRTYRLPFEAFKLIGLGLFVCFGRIFGLVKPGQKVHTRL
jgi:hypothetical protein